EAIANLPDVRFIQPDPQAMLDRSAKEDAKPDQGRRMVDDVHGVPSSFSVRPGFQQRGTNVKSFLGGVLGGGSQTNVTGTNAPTGVGSRSSEGDVTHRANIARGTFHIDGTGTKIGVMSNGVDGLAQSQALGDLGTVTVLPGQSGTGAEGTAMLEIVHDLA